jgi:hypothetical protein
MNNSKPWYLSKSILLSIAMGLLTTFAVVFPWLTGVTSWLTTNQALVAGAWSVLGILFRVVSKDRLTLGD